MHLARRRPGEDRGLASGLQSAMSTRLARAPAPRTSSPPTVRGFGSLKDDANFSQWAVSLRGQRKCCGAYTLLCCSYTTNLPQCWMRLGNGPPGRVRSRKKDNPEKLADPAPRVCPYRVCTRVACDHDLLQADPPPRSVRGGWCHASPRPLAAARGLARSYSGNRSRRGSSWAVFVQPICSVVWMCTVGGKASGSSSVAS